MDRNEPIEKIQLSERPKVSIVIPHFSESRKADLKKLIAQIKEQSFRDLEVIIVKGVSPQGKAINMGAKEAAGDVLMVQDDDSSMGHHQVIGNLVQVLQEDSSVAMAGASVLTPEDANPFQKRAAKQFPRFNMPVVKEVTDSDLACHGCVAFPKKMFMQVGMEREDILRGLDPDLRVRIRGAGYRVVLAPETWVYHPLPQSFLKFIRLFLRNGYGAAYVQVFHPEINYDTDERLHSRAFTPKRSLFYRILRYPIRLIQSLLTFQWLRFLGYFVYVFGYLFGYVKFSFLKLLKRS